MNDQCRPFSDKEGAILIDLATEATEKLGADSTLAPLARWAVRELQEAREERTALLTELKAARQRLDLLNRLAFLVRQCALFCCSSREGMTAILKALDEASSPKEAKPASEAPTVHCLKTWPEFYAAIVQGRKRFDIRRDDRGFREGDFIVFQEWDPEVRAYTGAETLRRVTYCLRSLPWVIPGYVTLSLEEVVTGPEEASTSRLDRLIRTIVHTEGETDHGLAEPSSRIATFGKTKKGD